MLNLTTPSPIHQRFMLSLEHVQEKILHLLASTPLLFLAIAVVISSIWLGGFLSRHMRVLTKISESNPFMEGLVRTSVKSLIGLIGVLIALDLLNATSLVGAVLGSAGVVGLVLGFAFKDIAENYIAGVLLSLRQPFSPGDSVRIDSYEGKVIALNTRATILMTAEGSHLQLPNSLVFKSVLLNFSRNPQRRFDFQINVEHSASLHQAMDCGITTLQSIDAVLRQPAPNALIVNSQTDGIALMFTGWVDQTHNDLSRTRSEAIRRVRRALWEAGMPVPIAQSRVILSRHEIAAPADTESSAQRDTSVDNTLDAQIKHAQEQESGNVLRAEASTAENTNP